MQILQIHIGPLSAEREACVASVREHYADVQYCMIDEKQARADLADMMQWLGLEAMPRRFDFAHPKGRVVISDWLRFWYLSRCPDMLYLDTDVLVKERFDAFEEKGMPYLLEIHTVVLDYAVIYSNGCSDWFASRMRSRAHDPNVFIGTYSRFDAHRIPMRYMHHYGPESKTEEHWQHIHWAW